MSVCAVVGANWGDEGKGKITDFLAGQADIVVRFQGGNNAGHTIINDCGKFALHLLPSGVFYPSVINVLGPGVALNIPAFLQERAELLKRGIPAPTLYVSERAQVVLPLHILFDRYEEERLGAASFGSTRSGIAPFYADKYAKIGLQAGELRDAARLKRRLERILPAKNLLLTSLYGQQPVELEALLEELLQQGEAIRPYLCDTTALLHDAMAAGKRILLEGQLGALRDPDHGIYPFSTSSSPLAGFATVGAGLPPTAIKQVVAVVKAYSSCVGAGPFVTEIAGAEAEELRRRGGDAGEYGATTGRPRRMGWFDAVATRYGCRLQGATEVALSLLDVLGYLEEIPLCTAYRVDGAETTHFPLTATLEGATPVYESLPGWQCDISQVRTWSDLPAHAQAYVRRIEGKNGGMVPARRGHRRILVGQARFAGAGRSHNQRAGSALQAATQQHVQLGNAAGHDIVGEFALVFGRDQAWKHDQAAGIDNEIVIAAAESHAAELDHAETPPLGAIIGSDMLEHQHPMRQALQLHVDSLAGAIVQQERGTVAARETLFEGENLPPVAQGVLRQQPHFGKGIDDQAAGPHAINLTQQRLCCLRQLDFGRMEERVLLLRLELALHR
jgi:adenylosuccinate synthase